MHNASADTACSGKSCALLGFAAALRCGFLSVLQSGPRTDYNLVANGHSAPYPSVVKLTRRACLTGVPALVASMHSQAIAGEPPTQPLFHDLEVDGFRDKRLGVRVLPSQGIARRTLILLHGLGETKSPRLGIKAWSHLYGLLDAKQSLLHPPITEDSTRYLTHEHASMLNASLAKRPFEPMLIACPVTPQPPTAALRPAFFQAYSEFLTAHLLPTLEKAYPGCTERVGLDGCSMGGYVALETLALAPERYRTFGMVQGAIGKARVAHYLGLLKHAHLANPKTALHFQTSSEDPFRTANKQLAKGLTRAGIANTLELFPGPHSQPWLREVGTLAMLRWHDLNL